MISIKPKDIPIYLKNSMFFEGLDFDDESFEIEEKYFKRDLIINSKEDFIHLIETLKFWDCKTKAEIPIDSVYNLILNIKENKIILKNMKARFFFPFLKYDFDSVDKLVKEDEYQELMEYFFDNKISEKELFKIYCIYEISKRYSMQYLFSQITDSTEQEILVLICFFNNCSFFDKPDLFNNYKIWGKVLSYAKDNILRYMLKNDIYYDSFEKNVRKIQLEKELVPYQKKYYEHYIKNADRMKKEGIFDDDNYFRSIELLREHERK